MSRRGPQLFALALLVVVALVAPSLRRLWVAEKPADASPDRSAAPPAEAERRAGERLPSAGGAGRRVPDAAAAGATMTRARRPQGAATQVHGRVAWRGGGGVAEIEVRLVLKHGARRRELGLARSDTEGRYRAEVELARALGELRAELARTEERLADALDGGPLDAGLARDLERRLRGVGARRLEPATLVAEVLATGIQPARARARLPGEAPRRVQLDLTLARGSGVHGAVFHRGEPAPGARVHLLGEDWSTRETVTADDLGRFTLPLPEPGPFRLHARLEGRGAAGTSGFSLGEALPHLRIDLDVDGLAAVYGRVRLFDGTPLPGLRVEALAATLFAEELAGGPALAFSDLARTEAGGGLFASETRSDERGRFALSGLARTAFALRLPGLPRPGLDPFGPYEPGGEERELVVDAHVLQVALSPGAREGARAGFDAPWIEVLCLRQVERGERRTVLRAQVPSIEPSAAFLVEPVTTWRVLARTPTTTGAAEVRVAEGRHLTRVELTLGPWDEDVAREMDLAAEDPSGRLEVSALDEAGRPAPELSLDLWPSADPGEPLLEGFEFGAGRALPALPPGRYDLRVAVLGALGVWSVPPPVRRGVELAPGAGARIELRLERGGRLRLSLSDVHVPRGFEQAAAVRARLRDLRIGTILDEPTWSIEGAEERFLELYPGEVGSSEAIAPGRYALTFESTWFSPPSELVVVRAAEWTEVRPLLVSEHVDVESDVDDGSE